MNNILSDLTIERINNYDTTQLKKLFDEVINDTDFQKRQRQQIGVNNRRKLISAKEYKPFGRNADGVPIYVRPDSKGYTGEDELNLKVHKDYVSMIATNKSGYLSGIDVVTDNEQVLDKINQFMKYNTFEGTHTDLVEATCCYAVKSLRLYSMPDSMIKFTEYEPWEYAPFYDKTGKLVGIMQWEETTKEIQNTYAVGKYKVSYLNDKADLYFYTDSKGLSLIPNSNDYPATVIQGVEIAEGIRPHTFDGVPVVEFWNNQDKIGDVEKTLDSQDVRDELVSKANTGFDAFSDVLLVDRTKSEEGSEISPEDTKEMSKALKDHGILTGDWIWLSKNYEGYQNLLSHLNLLEQDIFEGSNSFNPNQKSDNASSPTKYQIQQKYKPLMDSAVKTENLFKGAYLELFRLVLSQGLSNHGNMDYLDLDIVFKHTIPEDKLLTIKQLRDAGIPVPTELAHKIAGLGKWDNIEEMLNKEQAEINNEFRNDQV